MNKKWTKQEGREYFYSSNDEFSKLNLSSSQRYYRRHKQEERLRKKTYRQSNRLQHLFYSRKGSAKREGIEFTLVIDDIIIPKICPVYGIELQWNTGKKRDNSPSIDRLDPNLGYTKDNIRVISFLANRHKTNMSKEQITQLYKYINGEI